MTEKHLGYGRVQVFRDDERYCVWERHGIAHPSHDWHYARTDHIGGGEIRTGSYYCDGLTEPEAGKPFPLPPFDVVERAKAIETLHGLYAAIPFTHPDRPGVMRAIEVLRTEEPERT